MSESGGWQVQVGEDAKVLGAMVAVYALESIDRREDWLVFDYRFEKYEDR